MTTHRDPNSMLLKLINDTNGTAIGDNELVFTKPFLDQGDAKKASVTVTAPGVYENSVNVGYTRLYLDAISPSLNFEIVALDNSESDVEIVSRFLQSVEDKTNIAIAPDTYNIESTEDVGVTFAPEVKINVVFTGHLIFTGGFQLVAKYPIASIDMTSETLDSRVSYVCSSRHAFIDSDGLINVAEPNVYPVEYIDGEPAGRHEPEPQRTNLYFNNLLAGLKPYSCTLATSTDSLFLAPTAVLLLEANANAAHYCGSSTAIKVDANGVYVSSTFLKKATTNRNYGFLVAKHNSVSASATDTQIRASLSGAGVTYPGKDLAPELGGASISDFAHQYRRLVTWAKFDKTVTSLNIHLQGTAANLTSGLSFQGSITEGMLIDNPQLELVGGSELPVATSPIQSHGVVTTRSASFVTVETLGASKLRFEFSDGSLEEHDVSDTANFTIPTLKHDWGYRYIREISYIR